VIAKVGQASRLPERLWLEGWQLGGKVFLRHAISSVELLRTIESSFNLMSTPNQAPAPNRRVGFPFTTLFQLHCRFCAQAASSAAVGEARRCGAAMLDKPSKVHVSVSEALEGEVLLALNRVGGVHSS
jgi:hypothetical protein